MTNTSVDPNNLNPEGGEWIEINGTNLGPLGFNYPIEVTYGPNGFYYKATSCSIIVSSTILRCRTSAGRSESCLDDQIAGTTVRTMLHKKL